MESLKHFIKLFYMAVGIFMISMVVMAIIVFSIDKKPVNTNIPKEIPQQELSADKKKAEKDLIAFMNQAIKLNIFSSYDINRLDGKIYVSDLWYTGLVDDKKIIIKKIAEYKEYIYGSPLLKLFDSRSDQLVAGFGITGAYINK